MGAIDSLIFDLDGTLWDTCPSCAIGWNNVVRRHNIPFREITADDVRGVCGRPHDDCIRAVFTGLSEHHLMLLVEGTMTEDNLVVSKLGGHLYAGVLEGIRALRKKYRLFIVSNCQSGYIETFLKWSGLEDCFEDLECFGNTRLSKAENILSVIERNSLKAPVYIGDTVGDQTAAEAARVPFWFMSYGFGRLTTYQRKFDSFLDLVAALTRA